MDGKRRTGREGRRGTLYIVATPIGNLGDITLRGIETLKTVHLVAAEDTRRYRILAQRYDLCKRVFSCNRFNEKRRAEEVIALLKEGRDVALLSDSGTPGLSDPGTLLVERVIESGMEVVPVPGPSILWIAPVLSGIPGDTFLFAGFLPARKGERGRFIDGLRTFNHNIIFFESARRLAGSLKDLHRLLGDRRVAILREITKVNEEVIRGSIEEVIHLLKERGEIRGEVTVVLEGGEGRPGKEWSDIFLLNRRLSKLPPAERSRVISMITGSPAREVYRTITRGESKPEERFGIEVKDEGPRHRVPAGYEEEEPL